MFFEPGVAPHRAAVLQGHDQGHTGCSASAAPLVLNGVFDPFLLRLKVAFFFGLVVTCPIWLYQLWAFIAPGLYPREKRWTYAFVGTAVPLFLVGAAIAYFAMSQGPGLPARPDADGRRHPAHRSTPTSATPSAWCSVFGLAFELPLILVMLNLAGVLTHELFRSGAG